MTFATFIKNTTQFLFKAGFIFWLILAILELLMPGFVIYYINMQLWLIVVCCLAVARAFLCKEISPPKADAPMAQK
ncbi:hypothetical protein HY932_03340 [Candidatus Falkowbacteria bacterium]|nr:hypothetical protein [Candidatus Falkowbacteria bacterium]